MKGEHMKFILRIKHEKGTSISLVNTPDLFEAIKTYKKNVKGTFGKDKSTIIPRILCAEIEPLTYDFTL